MYRKLVITFSCIFFLSFSLFGCFSDTEKPLTTTCDDLSRSDPEVAGNVQYRSYIDDFDFIGGFNDVEKGLSPIGLIIGIFVILTLPLNPDW